MLFSLGKILFTTVRIFWTRPHEREIDTSVLAGAEYTPSDTKSFQYWTSHCKTACLLGCHEAISTIASIENAENVLLLYLPLTQYSSTMTMNVKIMLIVRRIASRYFSLLSFFSLSLAYPNKVYKYRDSCCCEPQSYGSLGSLVKWVRSRSSWFCNHAFSLRLHMPPCACRYIGCWSWWTLRGQYQTAWDLAQRCGHFGVPCGLYSSLCQCRVD